MPLAHLDDDEPGDDLVPLQRDAKLREPGVSNSSR